MSERSSTGVLAHSRATGAAAVLTGSTLVAAVLLTQSFQNHGWNTIHATVPAAASATVVYLLAAALLTVRSPAWDARRATLLAAGVAATAATVNLWGFLLPESLAAQVYRDAMWWHLAAAVLVTSLLLPAGAAAVAVLAMAAVPLVPATIAGPGSPPPPLAHLALLLLLPVAPTLGAWLHRGADRRWAATEERIRRSERLRLNQVLHATALPALEAIAMPVPVAAEEAPRVLRRLRGDAAVEARRLRRLLEGSPPDATAEDPGHPGLVAGLHQLLDTYTAQGLVIETAVAPVPASRLDPAAARALLVAVGEALSNVVKHAGSTRVTLTLRVEADTLVVAARDHGVGIPPEPPRGGFGLPHCVIGPMREVGGHAEVRPAAGGGTLVQLRAPLRPAGYRGPRRQPDQVHVVSTP